MSAPDSQSVRGLPSTAANGLLPVALWPGSAPIPAADDDAVTLAIPWYTATLSAGRQDGSR